jgi:hypothetical protein
VVRWLNHQGNTRFCGIRLGCCRKSSPSMPNAANPAFSHRRAAAWPCSILAPPL